MFYQNAIYAVDFRQTTPPQNWNFKTNPTTKFYRPQPPQNAPISTNDTSPNSDFQDESDDVTPIKIGQFPGSHQFSDRGLQFFHVNEEFPVSASHQLALITSLPFVHTVRRYYRLNDRSEVFGLDARYSAPPPGGWIVARPGR
ncbi:Uncharacterized protein FWK35_00033439 [Aphis craccivora]|uniref:Uncharacterized protein n=1 Tax=Aphis craccivora TaxID=307492 RepID=A0A6G0VLV0_APHCR|nr:Uncharacterized protein FWK35_00033439 [Aphis craccivora]